MTRDQFVSLLAEGIHTAFRKATDCPQAMPIHRLISEMPNDEWGHVVGWVADGLLIDGALEVTKGDRLANPRSLSTADGKAVTVTPSGSQVEVTHLYSLDGAPVLKAGARESFRPTAAEVLVLDGQTEEIHLSGPRASISGRDLPMGKQQKLHYQRHHAPWDDLPVWAEGLLTLHDSFLTEQS